MTNQLFSALYFVAAWLHPCLNPQLLFLKAQILIMREVLKRHGIEYPVLEPSEKEKLLRLGADLDHKVKNLFFINTLGTYRRWLRKKRNGQILKKPGRIRRFSQQTIDTVVNLAKDNTDWGYARIAGELKKLGKLMSYSSIRRYLRKNGIEPPTGKGKRKRGGDGNWHKFITCQMDTTVAVDYCVCKIITMRGIFLAHSLVFLHHGTRRVWLSWPTLNPDEEWNIRQLKGAFWWFEDQGIKLRYLIRDRDGKYSEKFDSIVKELTGNKRAVVRTSIRAPDMNAYAESMIGHMRAECHNHFWLFRSIDQLGRANSEYMNYHNQFRPHQSKENCVLDPEHEPSPLEGEIRCTKILGGLLRHYYRVAA